MIIYKITNLKNNKVYIGQTVNSLEDRWRRHQTDALNNVIDTHFARAIRYYKPESFIAEIIYTAPTQEELTRKEHDWILYYNSIENGYNETAAEYKSGGNTYKAKTPEELAIIKNKIRASKLGGNNPHATGVKCKNINTNEEYHFETQAQMRNFFNETNHQFCSRRCLHQIKSLYKDEWLIAYEQDDYISDYTLKKNHERTGSRIKVTCLDTGNITIYKSYRQAELDLHISRKIISDIANNRRPQNDKYIIELIK